MMENDLVERAVERVLLHVYAGNEHALAAGATFGDVLEEIRREAGGEEARSAKGWDAVRRGVLADPVAQACFEELRAHLRQVLVAERAKPIEQLALLPAAQRAELIDRYSVGPEAGRWSGEGDEATIGARFVACVSRHPDRTAVVCQRGRLAYAELAARVDALAGVLMAAGVEVGDRVALWMPASAEVPIAMLGALRAGAVFLPIDPGAPVARVRSMLEDSGAKVLLVSARERLPGSELLSGSGSVLVIEIEDRPPSPDEVPASFPSVAPRDGAYLIYTSGTTGEPKGVLIEHRSLAHYVRAFRLRHLGERPHRAALLTSHAFDLGYTAIWPTLLTGGELHLIPESTRGDVQAIARYLGEHHISFLKLTPSLLSALLSSSAFDGERCASLRLVVTGGEPVRARDVEQLYARCPQVEVVNHYGPTETTIGVTTCALERARLPAFARRPVIGRPLGDARAYIVSPSLQLLPIGAVGELLIGGPSVGRGYHRREALTAERFLVDPFTPPGLLTPERTPERGALYRTGDLARWSGDGSIELLGRADRQVKIRGYRVELSEIEQVFLRITGAREVAVVDRLLGEVHLTLCAYYVADELLDAGELARRLGELLPAYMVPASALRVTELPRSVNGKLDVARLPLPEPAGAAPGDPDHAPATATERELLALWSAVLGRDAQAVGVLRNFFELGGHSLTMIHLVGDIEDAFGVELPVSLFFEEGTVRALATFIDAARPQLRDRPAPREP